MIIVIPSFSSADIVLAHASTALTGTHTAFSLSSPPQPSYAALLRLESDDDEHNTGNNFLLLFADVDISPTLLEGPSEVDVLYFPIGCRIALDIITISQQYSLTPDHVPTPLDAELELLLRGLVPHPLYGGHDGQATWTTLVERDSHSKLHSVLSDLAVTLCQLQTLSAPPLPLCPLCLIAVSVHTTL